MTNSPGAENLMFARELFATWKTCGLGCVVLAPGARCAALALAARDTGLHVVRIDDERSAGFVALGWARVEGRPAAVVTTSGSLMVAACHPGAFWSRWQMSKERLMHHVLVIWRLTDSIVARW